MQHLPYKVEPWIRGPCTHTHTHRLANQMKPQIAVSHRQVNWCQFGGDREVEAITMAKEKEKS